MDRITEQIVDFAQSWSVDSLPTAAMDATINHLFDTIAVSIAGYGSEPAQCAMQVVELATSRRPATVFGYGAETTPDLAAFVNTIMVRTQDWNDGMQAKGGGHPSDMISGVLALGEIVHAAGLDVLVAVALAYELLGGLGADVPIGDLGFDQGTFMAPAVALAGGRLLELDTEQLANAVSLAMVPNVPLGVSRWGALSMMKGCATAFASRNGVFAALLAQHGFTSTSEPFEGYYGLQHQTGPFEPRLPVMPGGPSVVEMSHQKPIPAETQAIALIELVPKLRAWTSLDDLEAIELEVSEHVAEHIGDPPKYDPRTRETADHSLPYMLAAALVDGEITLATYRPERFLDPALRPVMGKIVIRATEEFTRKRAEGLVGVTRPTPARLRARRRDGAELVEEVAFWKGHIRNPMDRADLDAKLDVICATTTGAAGVGDEQRERIRDAWWNVAASDDIAVPIATLHRSASAPGD